MHGVPGRSLLKRDTDTVQRPRVVILGAGFAGLNAALALRKADVDVTIIDRRNYHLFQPLLYQVATAGLSPAQIATPIRRVLGRQKNTTILMAGEQRRYVPASQSMGSVSDRSQERARAGRNRIHGA